MSYSNIFVEQQGQEERRGPLPERPDSDLRQGAFPRHPQAQEQPLPLDHHAHGGVLHTASGTVVGCKPGIT